MPKARERAKLHAYQRLVSLQLVTVTKARKVGYDVTLRANVRPSVQTGKSGNSFGDEEDDSWKLPNSRSIFFWLGLQLRDLLIILSEK